MIFKIKLPVVVALCLWVAWPAFSQSSYKAANIRDMQWDSASNIVLTMANGQKITAKLGDIQHSRTSDSASRKFVYYPVMLASDFVDKVRGIQTQETASSEVGDTSTVLKPITLWGTMHSSLGGGWIHFINCMLLSLETRSMSLTSPLMERSQWKPNPPTETWKRTRNWKYYTPVEQRYAKKEYFRKKKENNLNNLQDVPEEFIDLFLNTSERQYRKMIKKQEYKKVARIDLVKLLIGANYLGRPQIIYVKTMVQKTVMQYAQSQLPTVIIFDDMDAAVVMSLNENGYQVEKVIFLNQSTMSDSERQSKELKIEISIAAINKANQKIFEERLKSLYR
jgi:hypothetical protein